MPDDPSKKVSLGPGLPGVNKEVQPATPRVDVLRDVTNKVVTAVTEKTTPLADTLVKDKVSPAITAFSVLRPVNLADLLQKFRPLPSAEFRVEVRRPDDFAVFDVIFQNLRLAPGTRTPSVIRVSPTAATYLVVELPAQSFGEQAFLDQTGPTGSGNPPKPFPGGNKNTSSSKEPVPNLPASKIRMAGKSRLAFTMPATVTELPLTLAAIMEAIRTWPERRDALAAPEPSIFTLAVGQASIGSVAKWIQAITKTGDWQTTSQTVNATLQQKTSADTLAQISAAADRVASQSAAAITSTTGDDKSAAISDLITAEINNLARTSPALNDADTRDLAVAALSIKATESLSMTKVGLGDDLSAVVQVPFLPLLLSPHQPATSVTALEVPYRLIVSPIESAHWTHSDQPVTDARSGRTELWHTRLTTSTKGFGPDGDAKIRAIWSPDYPIDPLPLLSPPLPFRMSLDPLDRQMLVKLMAGYNEIAAGTRRAYVPHATRTHKLMLSSLGAALDSEGSWSTRPTGVGLEQWRHIGTLGRDHYVRVVYAGFLCPFGHHASLIKVTERTFESQGGNLNHRVAILRQQFFVVVREPLKTYSSAASAPGWFDFPLTQVEIVTKITPSLAAPDLPICMLPNAGNAIYGAVPPRAAFWPMVSSGDFRFDMIVTDICGNKFSFAMPLLFIGDEANQNNAALAEVIKEYNATTADPRRTAPTSGATVGFAPRVDGAKGDPNLPASSISYTSTFANRSVLDPRFDPHFGQATVGIRQIQRLLGQTNAVVDVTYPDVYKAGGFGGANKGEVFLKLLAPHDLSFGGGGGQAKSDSLGALASPSMAIQGLSRIMGPVAAQPQSGPNGVENALQNVIGNKFDPTDFFKGAKILGGVDLSTILNVAAALTGTDVPKMVSVDLPDRVEASFEWQTEITKSDPLNLLVPTAGGQATILSMNGKVSAPIGDPAGATFDANAGMTNFKVNLFGFIIIWFDALTFKASRGKKPDVAVDMHPGDDSIVFGGPLEFVNDLRKFIPSNGFSDPPSLQVTPSGISASYSLSLPSIGVGIFTLANVSIGAGFSLPFDSSPVEVKFNFSERENPFSLTISLFGGGGFFAIGIGAEGVREIEAALEFGAAIAIDLGVASGGVEVKAGVYFHWLESGASKTVELAGYVRLHGELSILGLISASLTFNLQLSYLKQGSKSSVCGEATLTIEIDILFFSMSVSVKCRREFGGSPADPVFTDFIPAPALWAGYCEAFAAE